MVEQAKSEAILEEAGKAFAHFGFRKTSIEQIAKAAGVAKGTVYLVCESKADLFYQVLHREVRAWVAEVSKIIDPREAADQLLVKAGLVGIEYLEKRPLVKTLLFGEAHELLPKWGHRFDELAAIGGDNCIQILKLGIKQGLFRADLDVEEVAQIIVDHEIAWFILHDRGAADEEIRAARMQKRSVVALDLILHGLLRPKNPR